MGKLKELINESKEVKDTLVKLAIGIGVGLGVLIALMVVAIFMIAIKM